jgi:glycosyltransferase involved in cell wall biosynthesis
MKVAQIVGSLEARYGGPSRSVRRLAAAMAESGENVDILTSAPAAVPTENEGRLAVRTWRRHWPQAVCRVPDMARHLRAETYDVVHHHGLWLRTLHYARQKSAAEQIPLVVSPRGMMSTWAWRLHRRRKALAAAWIHPGAFAAVSGWHATSREEEAEIRSLGFEQPVCVAPNGVEAPDAESVASAHEHWRGLVRVDDGTRVALFYSRFHAKKRVIELIDLWASIAPAGWLLLVVGIPEQFSVAQLRDYVRRVQPAARIAVHSGAEEPQPYPLASLFLLPSHNENFGLVIAEAAANGIPAVVTNTTPWGALNREGSGWCVPWDEYAAALRAALAETPEALRERGGRARAWILREFSWDKSAGEVIRFYHQLKGGAP